MFDRRDCTMTAKKKSAPATTAATDAAALNTLQITKVEGKSAALVMAESALCGITANAITTRTYAQASFSADVVLGINQCRHIVREQAAKVEGGDLSELESLLTAQTTTLNAVFNEMARRAALNMGEHLSAMDTYMRLALKAQSQCRTTVEALAEIKNPRPVAFVKQANISHGHQQVNNGATHAHGKNPIQSNELSGASNELLPDTRASQVESRINPPVEAVGEINRAAN